MRFQRSPHSCKRPLSGSSLRQLEAVVQDGLVEKIHSWSPPRDQMQETHRLKIKSSVLYYTKKEKIQSSLPLLAPASQLWRPGFSDVSPRSPTKPATSSVLWWQSVRPESQPAHSKDHGAHCFPARHSLWGGGLDHPRIPEHGTAAAPLSLGGGIQCGGRLSHLSECHNRWDFRTLPLLPSGQMESFGYLELPPRVTSYLLRSRLQCSVIFPE